MSTYYLRGVVSVRTYTYVRVPGRPVTLRYLLALEHPGAIVDMSVIYASLIGLSLPATLLYYAMMLLVCRIIFERKVSE